MHAIVTSGGSGKVFAGEKQLLLNERSWWALERNLASAEIRDRLENNKYRKAAYDDDDGVSAVTDDVDAVEPDSNLKYREVRNHIT
jgi:hypothetical protein